MRKISLGIRLWFGFGVLLLALGTLGAISLRRMNQAKENDLKIAIVHVPEVIVAGALRGEAQGTMYDMSGYGYSEQQSILASGRSHLESLKRVLESATQHATGYPAELKNLAVSIAQVKTLVARYSTLIDDTEKVTTQLAENRQMLHQQIDRYLEQLRQYSLKMHKILEQDIGARTESAKVNEHFSKIRIANELIEIGSDLRASTWKAWSLRDQEAFSKLTEKFTLIDQKLGEFRALSRQLIDNELYEQLTLARQDFMSSSQELLNNWLRREEISKQIFETGVQTNAMSDLMVNQGVLDLAQKANQSVADLGTGHKLLIYGLGAAILIGLGASFGIARSITKALKNVITTVIEGSTKVASAAGKVSSTSQKLSDGATNQAAILVETASSLEEISSMAKQNAQNAESASRITKSVEKLSETGSQSMSEMETAVNAIKQASDETGVIIKTIDDIAFQTNLLALNAAVEAARAGEAGQGFAVVAEEVRNLAQKSAAAARETAKKIDHARQLSNSGVEVTREVSSSFREITGNSEKAAHLVTEIAAASAEQSKGLSQLNLAMAQLDRATQQNSVVSEESEITSKELLGNSRIMEDAIAELEALVYGKSSRKTSEDPMALIDEENADFQHSEPTSATADDLDMRI